MSDRRFSLDSPEIKRLLKYADKNRNNVLISNSPSEEPSDLLVAADGTVTLIELNRAVAVARARWQSLHDRADCWSNPKISKEMFQARLDYQDARMRLHTRGKEESFS